MINLNRSKALGKTGAFLFRGAIECHLTHIQRLDNRTFGSEIIITIFATPNLLSGTIINLYYNMAKEQFILNGLTVEKLSEMIREAVHEEMQQMQAPV